MGTALPMHWRTRRASHPDSALWLDFQKRQLYSSERHLELKEMISALRRGQSAGLSGYSTSEGDTGFQSVTNIPLRAITPAKCSKTPPYSPGARPPQRCSACLRASIFQADPRG